MRARETVSGLAAFDQRGPGTDAERRAAVWLAAELQAGGRDVRLEPFWCRPNWALAHAWHVAVGLAGSLLSVSHPRLGGALVLFALLAVLADVLTGRSPGRRLSPEHASQNVVSESAVGDRSVRLIVTCNYDAGRTALVYRRAARVAARRLRSLSGELAPGWLAWMVLALVWLLAVAIARLGGTRGSGIGAVQLIPTIGLVIGLALLFDLASAGFGPAAGDNGSGVAVAIALARALDAAPPRRLAVDIVLQGAGDGSGTGLRAYLRAHKRTLAPANTIVLGIAACGAGGPRWWTSDGALIPLRYHPRLRALLAELLVAEPELGAAPTRGRGATPALPARAAGLPAIAIGCLDTDGLPTRSHTAGDSVDEIDDEALGATLELALMLVDAIDSDLARTQQRPPSGG